MYLERLERALPEVRERILQACGRVGRSDAEAITIVAVSKGHPTDVLCAAREAGLDAIGENRVQEARRKWEEVGDLGLDWHLIGHLQRNKVRHALEMFSLIQSVGSLRLAEAISQEAATQGGEAAVLVQINSSGEAAKGGFPDEEADAAVREIGELPHVRVLGLMTMAPFTRDEEVLRGTFRRAKASFDRCADKVDKFEALHLSMGMTNDYEIAVEEGSTMLRLGTALFGERPQ